MQLRHPDDCSFTESAEPAGRRVPVHSGSAAVEQDRPAHPIGDGTVDRSPDRRRERHECHPVPFADHAQDAVAMFFTKVGDVAAGGLEDSQAQETEYGDQGEVLDVSRQSRRESAASLTTTYVNCWCGQAHCVLRAPMERNSGA
jgi:hypothetical protein